MNLMSMMSMSENEARTMFEQLRWPMGAECPTCRGHRVSKLEGKAHRVGVYKCLNTDCDRQQFTVTVNSPLERTRLPLKHWLVALYLMCASKKGISAHQLYRTLGVTYKTAWFMCHRIRAIMSNGSFQAFDGKVECDEVYVGGKSRLKKRGRGSERKTPVVVIVQRGGRAIAKPVERVDGKTLTDYIRANVKSTATIITDEWAGYKGVGKHFDGGHHVIRHVFKEYVRGWVHTNTAESFNALVKRAFYGTYHHYTKKHMFRYLNEACFKWNFRKVADDVRMTVALEQLDGGRLTYKDLIAA